MKKNNFIGTSFVILSCLTADYVISADSQKQETAQSKNDQHLTMKDKLNKEHFNENEKIIEINSINFIKLKSKPHEIFIPNPTIADVDMINDSSLYIMGLSPGVTSLVAHDKNGNVIANYQIRVTYPIKTIKKAITDMHPDTNVDIISVDNSLILKGSVPSPEIASDIQGIVSRFVDADKIINKMSIETATQVMLKVKIAEVSRNLTKSLGINWRAISTSKDVTGVHYGFTSGNAAAFPEFAESIVDTKKAFNKSGEVLGTASGGRWLMHSGGGSSSGLSGLIEALASESFASVLAEPTLIALSGKKATFKSGGEQGYTVKQNNSDSNTTEFKSWGTSIEFTPVVLSENRINITVKPAVSTVSFEGGDHTVPSLATKEAETTVELGSGQSLAIAGLIQTNKNTTTSETPFLADLPFIGSLFRNSNTATLEKELIIIVTPYIVKPSSKQLKSPTDMVPKMYSPLESILTRKFHKNIKARHSTGFMLR